MTYGRAVPRRSGAWRFVKARQDGPVASVAVVIAIVSTPAASARCAGWILVRVKMARPGRVDHLHELVDLGFDPFQITYGLGAPVPWGYAAIKYRSSAPGDHHA